MARKTLKFDINPLLGGPSLEARAKSGSPYRLIPIESIDVDPHQPRRVFDPEALSELAASIKEHGLLCPILVRLTAGGTYRVIAGERRYRASKMLGLEQIPAILDSETEGEDQSTLAKQLVENLQRQDLTPVERAFAIGQLRDQYGWSVREIARKLGTSKSLVQRSLEVLELPKELRDAIEAGAAESKVLLLAQVPSEAERRELLAQLDSLSRADIEMRLRGEVAEKPSVSHGGTPVKGGSRKAGLSVEDQRIVEDLQRALGTKVEIVRNAHKQNQGRVILDFYAAEDLEEIFRRLTAQAFGD